MIDRARDFCVLVRARREQAVNARSKPEGRDCSHARLHTLFVVPDNWHIIAIPDVGGLLGRYIRATYAVRPIKVIQRTLP